MPLDPQCQTLVDAAAVAGSPFAAGDHLALRSAYASTTAVYRHPTANLASVSDRSFRGPGGDVGVRIYVPHATASAPLPCLVYYHGGGWVMGDLDSHDHLCRYVAHGAAACVVAVDYRLAPEHKFPAPLDDCVAAFDWVVAHAAALNIDATRLALGGDSAGANLAAATAIDLRDAGGVQPLLQLLIYPAVDFTADNDSLRTNANGYLLTRAAMGMFTDFYLPDADARRDPRASPQLCGDHGGLPRAFIQSAEFDPLRDEAQRYAETLAAAGCRVDYWCYPGMVHGFARMGGKVDMALRALDDACAALRDSFFG